MNPFSTSFLTAALLLAGGSALAQSPRLPFTDQTPPAWQPLREGAFACRQQRVRLATAQRPTTTLVGQEKLLHQYDMSYVHLDIGLERTGTTIGTGSNVLTRARNVRAARALDTLAFELHPSLTIDSVQVQGLRVPTSAIQRLPTGDVNLLLGSLGRSVAPAASFAYQVWYHGTPASTGAAAIGDGITHDTSPSWGNDVTWTLSESFSAYEWWPSKQVLSDKIDSSRVWITTDAANKAGSNGVLERVTPRPGNKARYEWLSKYPIDYYLISASVAKYVDYTITAHPVGLPAGVSGVPVVNYVYDNPGTLPRFQADIDTTTQFIELFSQQVGLYPFWREKYGHCMAPLGGGMEHQTMTTLGYFNFTLVAHELFHQWFGDHVTCKSWRDIWLNESFASYGEYLALESVRSPGQAREWLVNDAHANAFQAPTGSLIVPESDSTDVGRIFDYQLTYRRGASVIHMLRHVINNDSAFFAALTNYQQQFAYGVATTANLQQSLEQSLAMPLGWFFDQWVRGEGYPTATVRWNQVGQQLVIRSVQQPSGATPFFRMPIEFDINTGPGQVQTVRLEQTQPTQLWTVALPTAGNVRTVQVDPRKWNLLDVNGPSRDTSLQPTGLAPATTRATLVGWPNPCTTELHLPAELRGAEVEVVNLLGQVVRRTTLPAADASLSTAALAAGAYVLRVAGAPAVRFVRQ